MKFLSVLAFTVAITLTGCKFEASEDHSDSAKSFQDLRANMIREFSDNPARASEKYRSFYATNKSHNQTDLITKVVACGLFEAHGLQRDEGCSRFIQAGLRDTSDEVRAISLSALALTNNEDEVALMADGLNDRSDLVHIEAAQALAYRFDTFSADPNDPDKATTLRIRLEPYCVDNESASSALSDLCSRIK